MIKTVLTVMLGITIIGGVGTYESTYTRTAEVVEVNNNLAIFTDATGNDWYYYFDDGTDIKIGDNVKLIMDTMHTDSNIYDDEIKKIVLDKWVKDWYNKDINKKEVFFMMILGLYIEKGYETALVDCSTGEILSQDRDEIVRILAINDGSYLLQLI